MPTKIGLYFICLLLVFSKAKAEDFGEDEFGEETTFKGKNVQISDAFFPVSLSLIALYKVADKAFIRPAAIGYRALTPQILRYGIQNSSDLIMSILHLPNALLVFNIDGVISNTGYILSSISLGGGLSKLPQDFNLKETPVKFSSVFRFYRIPELFYLALGPLIVTFPDVLSITTASLISDIFFPPLFFTAMTAGAFINLRAQNLEALDTIFSLPGSSIYENLKTSKYMEAKNFRIERNFLKQEGKTLQKEIEYSRNGSFLN